MAKQVLIIVPKITARAIIVWKQIVLLIDNKYLPYFTEIRYLWTIPIRYRFDIDSIYRIYVVKLVFTASIRYRLVARSHRYRICIESMLIKITFRRCNREIEWTSFKYFEKSCDKLIRRCNRNVARSNGHRLNILKNRVINWFDVVIATWRDRMGIV